MTFTVHDMLQRSPEWYAARVGLLTGSCAGDVLAVRKRGTGELAARKDLRRRLVAERVTGQSAEDTFQTRDMERGILLEADAFFAYECATGQGVQRVGFVTHNELKTGGSPDGYIGNWEGCLELKVPRSTTHLSYLQAGVLPDDYRAQCLHALWLTGAHWIDFCSFDPRFPEPLQLFRVRLERSEAEMAAYELAVTLFLDEVAADIAQLLQAVQEAA